MTEVRKGEILAKIAKIVANDLTAFSGTESDIKVFENGTNGDYLIDIALHYMKSDEDQPDLMNISYAATKSLIKNANIHQEEKALSILQRIVQLTVKGMKMPGGD